MSPRIYLAIFLAAVLTAVPAGVANYLFLKNAGELEDVGTIARDQQRQGGLYGTALRDTDYAYKLELFRARRPRVVAVGSSRMMMFRDAFFTVPFTNLSRAMNSLAEGQRLADQILGPGRPDVVLMGVDHWWFGGCYARGAALAGQREARGTAASFDAVALPARWLLDERIRPAQYAAVVGGYRGRDILGVPLYGVQALIKQVGWVPDGSHYQIWDPSAASFRTRFDVYLRKVDIGLAKFRHNYRFDPRCIDAYRALVERIVASGARLVTFTPPLAVAVLERMAARPELFANILALYERLSALSPEHYDLLDPRSFGATDAEMFDGTHASDVASLRMLIAMAQAPGAALRPFVDLARARRLVDKYAGRPNLGDCVRLPESERELDPLGAGCGR